MAGPNDAPGPVQFVSTSAQGVPGNQESTRPAFSPDGRKIAFDSLASNLVAGDANGRKDAFLKDLSTGSIVRLSTNAAGVEGDNDSTGAVFSPDGTKVAFVSLAGNLVANDADIYVDVFVKDLTTGTVTLVSSDALGAPGGADSSTPVFAPDGRHIAFVTRAALLADDTNRLPDIYLKDLATGALTRLSLDANGRQIDGASSAPAFSPDGSKLAFLSDATLADGATAHAGQDVYLKDLATGAITLVSRAANNADGTPGAGGNSQSLAPVFSPNGTRIAFWSSSSNLTPADTTPTEDIFVKDLVTGAVTIATAAQDGTQFTGSGNDDPPSFSPDGTKLLFSTPAGTLVPGDTNGTYDVFAKDLLTGAVTRLSTAADGAQASGIQGVWSPDGTKIAFLSGARNLVPGTSPGDGGIFVKEVAGAVAVNTPPVAGDDGYLVLGGAPLVVDAPGVLANDRDREGNALSAALVAGPQHGTLMFSASGAFTYTPEAGFRGRDSFTYQASDALALSNLATVTLTVDALPVAADDRYVTGQNARLDVAVAAGVLANDTDADGDRLTAALVSGPQHGTLQLAADGSFSYIPQAGYRGSDAFTYRADDGTAQGNVATVAIEVRSDAGRITIVSTASDGTQGDSQSDHPVFTPDGNTIIFESAADNLVPGDTNRIFDVFAKNLLTGAIMRLVTPPSTLR